MLVVLLIVWLLMLLVCSVGLVIVVRGVVADGVGDVVCTGMVAVVVVIADIVVGDVGMIVGDDGTGGGGVDGECVMDDDVDGIECVRDGVGVTAGVVDVGSVVADVAGGVCLRWCVCWWWLWCW